MARQYDQNVFVNCPFDAEYAPIFEAIIFAVHDAGFRPICARSKLDSSQIRLQKIFELIASSRYSVPDLSRTSLDDATGLPRFNMALELGIDLGCKQYSPEHSDKSVLVFDAEQYRYQKYVSDLAGQDIARHENEPEHAVGHVRDWLRTESRLHGIPGGYTIYKRYEAFRADLPTICSELKLDIANLAFADFSYIVARWLDEHPWRANPSTSDSVT
jgi:hypothetical protein